VNDPELTKLAHSVARELFGESPAARMPIIMASEDFAYMLRERPGCLLFIGNGDQTNLHSSGFVLNDDILVTGVAYWAALVERFLA
jgi:hippurate hydrolase